MQTRERGGQMHTHRGVIDERTIENLQMVGASRLRVNDGS